MNRITTDRNDPGINVDRGDGQNEAYIVLSEEERAKGFIRPLRTGYIHKGQQPENPLQDLTDKQKERHLDRKYVKFEEYPKGARHASAVGRFWTQEQLDSGCNSLTTMGKDLAETYAREPGFYGSTFCCGCGKHFPVGQFVWDGTDEVVGS